MDEASSLLNRRAPCFAGFVSLQVVIDPKIPGPSCFSIEHLHTSCIKRVLFRRMSLEFAILSGNEPLAKPQNHAMPNRWCWPRGDRVGTAEATCNIPGAVSGKSYTTGLSIQQSLPDRKADGVAKSCVLSQCGDGKEDALSHGRRSGAQLGRS